MVGSTVYRLKSIARAYPLMVSSYQEIIIKNMGHLLILLRTIISDIYQNMSAIGVDVPQVLPCFVSGQGSNTHITNHDMFPVSRERMRGIDLLSSHFVYKKGRCGRETLV